MELCRCSPQSGIPDNKQDGSVQTSRCQVSSGKTKRCGNAEYKHREKHDETVEETVELWSAINDSEGLAQARDCRLPQARGQPLSSSFFVSLGSASLSAGANGAGKDPTGTEENTVRWRNEDVRNGRTRTTGEEEGQVRCAQPRLKQETAAKPRAQELMTHSACTCRACLSVSFE